MLIDFQSLCYCGLEGNIEVFSVFTVMSESVQLTEKFNSSLLITLSDFYGDSEA